MKALILAAGAGTRLRPITHTRAKQLVPVANTPILHDGIRSMVSAGITELGVIVGDASDEVMADLGDNLLEQDLEAFIGAFAHARSGEHPPSAQILLKEVSDPHRFGIASLDGDGNVEHLVEKQVDPPSNLALVGVYLFDREIHEAVAAIEPSERGELEITDAIQWLIDHGRRVRTEILTGWWIDAGKLTPLLEANRLILETIATRIDGEVDADSFIDGRVVIETGAEIINSTIRGPVAIGAGTKVVDSLIGPFSAIGVGCEVRESEIEHSVVMDRSQVIDIPRLEDSLIGSDAVVSRTRRKPRAIRLMVGDHFQIDVEEATEGASRCQTSPSHRTSRAGTSSNPPSTATSAGCSSRPTVASGFPAPAKRSRAAWDDPAIAGNWGVTEPILSERDQQNPLRADLPTNRRPYRPMRT